MDVEEMNAEQFSKNVRESISFLSKKFAKTEDLCKFLMIGWKSLIIREGSDPSFIIEEINSLEEYLDILKQNLDILKKN